MKNKCINTFATFLQIRKKAINTSVDSDVLWYARKLISHEGIIFEQKHRQRTKKNYVDIN